MHCTGPFEVLHSTLYYCHAPARRLIRLLRIVSTLPGWPTPPDMDKVDHLQNPAHVPACFECSAKSATRPTRCRLLRLREPSMAHNVGQTSLSPDKQQTSNSNTMPAQVTSTGTIHVRIHNIMRARRGSCVTGHPRSLQPSAALGRPCMHRWSQHRHDHTNLELR